MLADGTQRRTLTGPAATCPTGAGSKLFRHGTSTTSETKATSCSSRAGEMQMSSRNMKSYAAALSRPPQLVALAMLSGCHKKNSGINPSSLGPTAGDTTGAAPTATLSADPLSIDLGQIRRPQLAHAKRDHRNHRRHRHRSTTTAPRPSRLRTRRTSTSSPRATVARPRPTCASRFASP